MRLDLRILPKPYRFCPGDRTAFTPAFTSLWAASCLPGKSIAKRSTACLFGMWTGTTERTHKRPNEGSLLYR